MNRDGKDRVAFKTRVYFNNRQAAWMQQNCIAARLAYNFAVSLLNDPNKTEFVSAQYAAKRWRAERDALYPWMKEKRLVMGPINDSILVNFNRAMVNWKRSGWAKDSAPCFHKRSRKKSIMWNYLTLHNRHIKGKSVKLPQHMGHARLAQELRFNGPIKQVTFSESGGKWYASFLIEAKAEKPKSAPRETSVGIDLGVAKYATLSTGEHYTPLSDTDPDFERLAKLQRQAAKMKGPIRGKQRASQNWLNQQKLIAKQHRRIANKRKDYIERITKDIASQYGFVCIEDLDLKKMTKSIKGTKDKPAKGVKAKSSLNRSILHGAFGQFRIRLEAKVKARDGELVAVNPAYTSQACVACGHTSPKNRPNQATFKCVECGHEDNADANAAKNILLRGLLGEGVVSA